MFYQLLAEILASLSKGPPTTKQNVYPAEHCVYSRVKNEFQNLPAKFFGGLGPRLLVWEEIENKQTVLNPNLYIDNYCCMYIFVLLTYDYDWPKIKI
jgi:hypothetical protein